MSAVNTGEISIEFKTKPVKQLTRSVIFYH